MSNTEDSENSQYIEKDEIDEKVRKSEILDKEKVAEQMNEYFSKSKEYELSRYDKCYIGLGATLLVMLFGFLPVAIYIIYQYYKAWNYSADQGHTRPMYIEEDPDEDPE